MTTQSTGAGPDTGLGAVIGAASAAPAVPLMHQQTVWMTPRQTLLKDVRLRWEKFTEQELRALTSNDDLVNCVVAKYGLDRAEAQRQADTLRAGRDI
jgi:hypothetical protein